MPGPFPMAVCPSSRPSPVTTTSASRMPSSIPVFSITIFAPGSSSAFKKVRRAKPSPPAAPLPAAAGSAAGKMPCTSFAYRSIQPSISSASFGSAPFWGPNTRLAPPGPQRGLVTSQAARKRHRSSPGSTRPVSIKHSSRSPAAPSGTAFLSLSKKSQPSACSIPMPPSLVALPPMPIINSVQPLSTASRIISPTPRVVVRKGVLSSFGTRGRPAAAAISITAVRCCPSCEIPYPQATGSPSGPVTVTCCRRPRIAVVRVSAVPSPPSASKQIRIPASGQTRRIPASTASPASREDRLPFIESMAISIFIPSLRPAFPCIFRKIYPCALL